MFSMPQNLVSKIYALKPKAKIDSDLKPLINEQEVRHVVDVCVNKADGKRIDMLGIYTNINPSGYERQIRRWLDNLPDSFRLRSGSYGDYWEKAYFDRNGVQWTHRVSSVSNLVLLGLSIGRLRFSVARQEWNQCPDGLPPFVYLDGLFRKKD